MGRSKSPPLFKTGSDQRNVLNRRCRSANNVGGEARTHVIWGNIDAPRERPHAPRQPSLSARPALAPYSRCRRDVRTARAARRLYQHVWHRKLRSKVRKHDPPDGKSCNCIYLAWSDPRWGPCSACAGPPPANLVWLTSWRDRFGVGSAAKDRRSPPSSPAAA